MAVTGHPEEIGVVLCMQGRTAHAGRRGSMRMRSAVPTAVTATYTATSADAASAGR
jgi:hypothetical protein